MSALFVEWLAYMKCDGGSRGSDSDSDCGGGRRSKCFILVSVFFKVSSASERRNRKTKTNDIKTFLEYRLGKHMAEMRRLFVRHTNDHAKYTYLSFEMKN